MLARDGDRLTQTQTIGLDHARVRQFAFSLVSRKDHRLTGSTQNVGKDFVNWRDPCPRVYQEQA